jgi:hypothetical protein
LQENAQVEVFNNTLKTILQWMINEIKSNWNIIFFLAFGVYQTSVKTTIGFTPFHLMHGLEAILPIEFSIPSFQLVVELLPNATFE